MSDYYYFGPDGDEEKLSNVMRDPVGEKPLEISRKTRLASGKLVKDIIATKRVFDFHWERLPGQDDDVIDDGIGRDRLRELYDDGDNCVLQVRLEEGGYEEVEVSIREYQETCVAIRPFFEWEVKMTLEEV